MIQVVFVSFLVLLLEWNVCYAGRTPCAIPAGYEGVTCACEVPGKGIIDLRPIAVDTENGESVPPKFVDVKNVDNSYLPSYHYSYNPCYGYNQGPPDTSCYDASLISSCQYAMDFHVTYTLGSSETEKIYIDGNSTYLEYTGGEDGRITRVYLKCDESATEPVITTTGDSEKKLTYVFYLTTKYACPSTDPPSKGPPSQGL